MPLYRYHPKQGEVLYCDFDRGFVPPEIVKSRKVVVVSPTARNIRRLCTVVPISATEPENLEPWHYEFDVNPLPSDGQKKLWAKCDMLYTVSFDRLDRLHRKTRRGREYFAPRLANSELEGVLVGVKAYLCV